MATGEPIENSELENHRVRGIWVGVKLSLHRSLAFSSGMGVVQRLTTMMTVAVSPQSSSAK